MSSNNNTKHNLQPKLRFPEFRDAGGWEKKKLSDLLFETRKRNRELRYSANNVLSVSGEFGCVNQIELLGRSYAGVSVANYHIVETGDIVYTKSPLKKNPYGIIKENKGIAGIVSTLYAVYRPTELAISTYLDHYFSRDYNLNSYLQPIVRKGAKNDMKVNNTAVLGGEIWTPNRTEQKKIANCLSSLDALIAAQAQKVEALKAHKKGLMQELFPAEGETLPKLRFPEFRDAPKWEEKTISTICHQAFSGGTPITTEKNYYGGDIPFIRSAEIAKSETELFLTKEGLSNSAARMVGKGDVLVALYGANSGDVALSQIDGAINQAILCLKSDYNEFIYQFLSHRKSWIVAKYIQGGQGNLSGEIVRSIKLSRPTQHEEQKRIADCLSSLDELITAQSQKLDALRQYKKGLMQQLFPSPEDVEA
jgi:type I restriction enzyme S subunit